MYPFNLKIINCLVCGRKMKVDSKAKCGMCWRCVNNNRFEEYRIKKEQLKTKKKKQKKKRRKNEN